MPLAPSGMMPAQIRGNRQQPGGKFAFEVKTASMMVNSNECFLRELDRVCVVADVSENERMQRLLPSFH